MFERGPNLWVVILAAGSGTRLSSLTKALYGCELPKQYAVLSTNRTLLQQTVERALCMTDAERIVVVVAREHVELARQQLGHWPKLRVLIQPRNLGTGTGVVLPLSYIRSVDSSARVAVLPSDHYVAQVIPLIECLNRATAAIALAPRTMTLIGAQPDSDDPDYGWIVPDQTVGRLSLRAVSHFVEKPGGEEADRLQAAGALWNTFMMVGLVETLWHMTRRALPVHCQLLDEVFRPDDPAAAASLQVTYGRLPSVDFCKQVLEGNAQLNVLPLPATAGWSDWGTPRRVFQSLQGTPALEILLQRITGQPTVEAADSLVA